MINLLSPQARKNFIAGRVNTVLVRYLWIIAVFFGVLAIVAALAYFMLSNIQASAQREIDENNAKASSLQDVKDRATEFQSNLKIAKYILDQQTNYSVVLLKVASILPQGAVLSGITLDASTYGKPMEIEFAAVNKDIALAVKTAFESSDLFSDVQFKALSSGEDTATSTKYPVIATLQATVNKEATKQ